MATSNDKHLNPLSAAGVLISLGIIYGDIGTSPIYTFRFIVGEHIITEELIFGGHLLRILDAHTHHYHQVRVFCFER